MPVLRATALFILMLACGGCALLRLGPPQKTAAPAVRDLAAVQEILQTADAASARVLLTEIGRVNAPGFDAPIWRVAYRPFKEGLKRVLLIAGLHGNETAGVDYVLTLVEQLGSAPGSAAGCDMDILPMVNPWGWVHDRPLTTEGIDIVDDFNRFDSHEARVLRRFLREKHYDLVLDLREDSQAKGFYLRRYGADSPQASTRAVDQVRRAGYPIESEPHLLSLKPGDGAVDIPLWHLAFWRLTRQLTIAGYMRRNVSNGVFTIVTPARLPLQDRIAMQKTAVEALLAELAEPNNQTRSYAN